MYSIKKIIEFSKSYENILKIKNDFYHNNFNNLKYDIKIINKYKKKFEKMF